MLKPLLTTLLLTLSINANADSDTTIKSSANPIPIRFYQDAILEKKEFFIRVGLRLKSRRITVRA